MAYDEDEQIARFQQWWNENWKALVGGLVIGIGGILGWNAWQSYGEQQAETASLLFSEVIGALDAGNREVAEANRQTLIEDYRRTPYAVAASMHLAAAQALDNQFTEAAESLQWARDNARDPAMEQLATIRLARLRWAQGEPEAALSLLDEANAEHFVAVREELRGDILLDQGERAAAYQAFSNAFAAASQEARELLQQKLDDLADVAVAMNGDN